MIKNAFHSLLHLLLPHQCAGCGSDVLSEEQLLCLSCIENLPVTNFHLHPNNPVEKIFWGRIPVCHASSYLYFTKNSLLQQLVHEIKYKGNKELGEFMGERIGLAIRQSNRFNNLDALIPLPLFAARERKRGYNQAGVICRGIARILNIPVMEKVIVRKKATETQTRKSRLERWQNIEGKFELVDASYVEHKHILLVDDVVTTGATLEACGQTLLANGNTRLSIFTLAYTLK